jgi:hypothetical protein
VLGIGFAVELPVDVGVVVLRDQPDLALALAKRAGLQGPRRKEPPMPSPKHISLLLIASLALLASLNHARAAQDPVLPATEVPAALNDVPDEARIADDLTAHSQIASLSAVASTPSAELRADHTSIRSSVRKGEVLEFRVTSLYYAATQGQPLREVDSMVSYRMTGDRWSLQDVKVTDTRETQPADTESTTEPC